jgi:hypothetical protein
VDTLRDPNLVQYTKENADKGEEIYVLQISCRGAMPVQLLNANQLEARATVNILIKCFFVIFN